MSATSTSRSRLLVVACGGTISSVRSSDEAGATPKVGADRLVSNLPGLALLADVDTMTASMLPSPHMTLDEVLRLHQAIETQIDECDGISGVVVTHGTDTLEEVAFALDLLWRHSMPLVLTGAMRNISLPGADGPANLMSSAITALSPSARGLGVLVVFNDQIHAARFVRKSHTSNVATFQSPSVGPLGYITEGTARVVLAPRRRGPVVDVPISIGGVAVALLKMSIGDDGRLLEHIASANYRGVVIEGFGGGHVTREIAESAALARLLETMPVVLSSRAGSGEPLRCTYSGFAGSEMDMLDRGVISSGVLDGPKSRVLLTLLLANGVGSDKIREAFGEHGLYGVTT